MRNLLKSSFVGDQTSFELLPYLGKTFGNPMIFLALEDFQIRIIDENTSLLKDSTDDIHCVVSEYL
jgi:hypothetical protein